MSRLWKVILKTPSPLHQRSVKVWHYLVLADGADQAIALAKAALSDATTSPAVFEGASAEPEPRSAVLLAVTTVERRRRA